MQRTKRLHNKVHQQAESWIASNIWLPLGYCCYETFNITNSKCRCNSLGLSHLFFFFTFVPSKHPPVTHCVWLYVWSCVPSCQLTTLQWDYHGLMATATGEWHKTDQLGQKCSSISAQTTKISLGDPQLYQSTVMTSIWVEQRLSHPSDHWFIANEELTCKNKEPTCSLQQMILIMLTLHYFVINK